MAVFQLLAMLGFQGNEKTIVNKLLAEFHGILGGGSFVLFVA
jgi:hypothetical protein